MDLRTDCVINKDDKMAPELPYLVLSIIREALVHACRVVDFI